jgi:murein DD-endopeptidase MepM/ murein hydrolase activator NlpD
VSKVKSSQVKSSQVKSKLLLLGVTSVTVFVSTISTALAENYLPYPAGGSYQVTQSWGGTTSHQNQNAVDFGMPANSPVAAAASGKVVKAWSGGSNLPRGCSYSNWPNANHIEIDHGNGTSSTYLHLNAVNVSVGQSVSQGQVIGLSGDTGYTCGAHLHFAFKKSSSSSVFAADVAQGFVETGNGMPVTGRSYLSQNRNVPAIPSETMLVSKETKGALDGCGGSSGTDLYIHPNVVAWSTCQKWQLKNLGNDEYMVINRQTQRPLDGGGANGVTPYLYPQQLGNRPQRWKLQQSGDGYMFINVDSGRVLDSGGSVNPHAYMYPNAIPGHSPHIWKFQ